MLRQFGSKLRHLRIERGLTQTDLARQLSLARPAHVSNLEAGRRDPSLDLVVQIAELLEVPTEYLLRDTISIEAAIFYAGHAFSPQARMARHFGSKLYHLRILARMTQVELARRLALSAHVHISTLESGRKDPSIDLVLKIADLLGVTTDYLLRDTIPVELAMGEHTSADGLSNIAE